MDDYARSLDSWRADRIRSLTAEDGWLNIIGRWPLETGSVKIGSSSDNNIVLSTGPAGVGTLTQDDAGQVFFAPGDGGPAVNLVLDKKHPPRFTSGDLLLEVTTLNGSNALRVRDTKSPARESFPGIDHFPTDPAWRIVADWVRLDEAIETTVDTVIGVPAEVTITHKAVFTHDGKTYELLPTHGTPQRPQFVIRDLTSRSETYPASRFLFGEDISGDTIVLDFNKAINPPCAFSDHAVCPLPPPQNVLPFRIEAGELNAH